MKTFDPDKMCMEEIGKVSQKILKEVHEQREEILRAFVAKYGFGPDECEQVTQVTSKEVVYFVRKRDV